jgi:2-oxoglutarate ferredoxin oxidoreductase subunit beta
MWCAGCGHGMILKGFAQALGELEIAPEQVGLVTGIGCCGRTGEYVQTHRFQGTHGRALPIATGLSLAKPELKVIAIMGDGDCGAIGGNHLLHAARRNVNITAIVANNLNYGMTGGQFSAFTPVGKITNTSKKGKAEGTFDLGKIAQVAGASYVARSTAFHFSMMVKLLKEAISCQGFSLVEVLVPCTTYYGRYNKLGDSVGMLHWLKEHTVSLEKFDQLPPEEKQEKFWIGVLENRRQEDFLSRYLRVEGVSLEKSGGKGHDGGEAVG